MLSCPSQLLAIKTTLLTRMLCLSSRGLRAIKSVLVVAGSLLRAEEGQVEAQVLFRALRDFNIPKILAQVRGVWWMRRATWGGCTALHRMHSSAPGLPPLTLLPSQPKDMVIFMGLLNDLFPGVDPPRKRDLAFEEVRVG